ncbi:PE family protein [Mycobacterium angelicum]|uniref:PE family protein n=1 Tax=Mycobacterium angelicum TaxID=470074 RepID=A0A1W9ZPA4_MYCAN|nr:PE family protein [Mycobacterium angelicum]MCV7198787.1 PE family protein [Mycobacterium angelicum]ORA19356.1 PE family protein [Mycobacterium angelicum]
MQPMTIGSAAADIGSQISDNAFQGLQAAATASTSLTSLLPAGGEEVSAQAAMSFAADGARMIALNQAAQEELARAGAALIDIARMYADVDAHAAGLLLGAALR